MEVKKYKKKPVEIEAIKFVYDKEGIKALFNFGGDGIGNITRINDPKAKAEAEIITLEDGKWHYKVKHIATEGDYIIKGIKGELYPCKPDIFEETYEEIEE